MHQHGQRGVVMACQMGANRGSVSDRVAIFASTITPTAPLARVRASSSTASAGCCQGREVNQRMRSGYIRCAAAISSFTTCAARKLTSGVPQYTFGQVSETIAIARSAGTVLISI